MLENLSDLPYGVDGMKAVGKISKQDYEDVFEPILRAARREGRRMRFLYQLGAEYDGFTPSAAWEDANLGFARGAFSTAARSSATWAGSAKPRGWLGSGCRVRSRSSRMRSTRRRSSG